MKKRLLAVLLAIVMVLGLAVTSFAANGTGHQISVKIYKVVLDSSKPLGYQNPELINTITITCQDSTAHSGYNHSANLKDFYPTAVGASTTDWTGWEFAAYYTKGAEMKTFYSWTSDKVNATANVTGSEPYPCSKNFYLVYKDVAPVTYTVTYNDGAANGASFADQVHSGLAAGAATPAWQGTTEKPVWTDHVFAGWSPAVAEKVTGSVTYVAQWKDDKNNNGIADDEEDKLIVIYNDGAAQGASFADQRHEVLPLMPTPAWQGRTEKPVWEGHVFVGWEPEVAEKVTESVTYVAQWKDDKNNNGIADDEEDKLTVIYNDGEANGASFADQKHENLLAGTPTPEWDGNGKEMPVWEDHVFVGWEPEVDETVTKSVTYVAQWKDDKNHNGEPDDAEEHFTVIYNDGEAKGASFAEQKHENVLVDTPTPAWEGTTEKPVWKDHLFAGWKPEVAETVTESVTYVAQWKNDRNNNGIDDDQEDKYTVTYTDGVEDEEIFKDQVYEGLLTGEATPKFDGKNPTRKGYTFAGWKPEVAKTVTETVTYVAQWKELDAVQTADSMNLTVWFCLLGVAGMGFVSALVLLKKKQSDK